MGLEEDDPGDQPIGMVHLLDAFLAALLGHVAEAPVLLQPVVQPVLAHRLELGPQQPSKLQYSDRKLRSRSSAGS